jgi:hypothetical protein
MASRRPSSPRTHRFPLLVESPPESNRRPHPYHSCGPSPIEESAQVNVTRVTVSDRQAPPAPAVYGTQMARPPTCGDPVQASTRSAFPVRWRMGCDRWRHTASGLGPSLRCTPSFKRCFRSSAPFVGVCDWVSPTHPVVRGCRHPPVLLSADLVVTAADRPEGDRRGSAQAAGRSWKPDAARSL